MREMFIQLAEMNLRWSHHRLYRAKMYRRGLFIQAILFGSFAVAMMVLCLLTGSMWTLGSVAIYIAAVVFFAWRALHYGTDQVWKAVRQVAQSRNKLRDEMESD